MLALMGFNPAIGYPHQIANDAIPVSNRPIGMTRSSPVMTGLIVACGTSTARAEGITLRARWHAHGLVAACGHRCFHRARIALRGSRHLLQPLARLLGQSPAGSGKRVAELFRRSGANDRTGDLRLFDDPAYRDLRGSSPQFVGDSEQFGQYDLVPWVKEPGRVRPVLGRA